MNLSKYSLPALSTLLAIAAVFQLSSCQSRPEAGPGKITSFDEVPISYNVSGKGKIPVVFIHGWNIDQTYWEMQLPALEEDYLLVTIDLAGHGTSGNKRKEWTVDAYANDVISVIDHLGLDDLVLVGHSMGGNIMLAVYEKINDQVIGLVGVDNLKDIDFEMTAEVEGQMTGFFNMLELDYRMASSYYTRNMLFTPNSDTAAVNRVLKDVTTADPKMSINILKNLFPEMARESEIISNLHLPLYLIVSDATPTDTAALSASAPYGYYIKTVEGVGHYPMIEDPETFNHLLTETLTTITQ